MKFVSVNYRKKSDFKYRPKKLKRTMAKSKSPMAQMKNKVDMKKYIHSGKHWGK
jgi:hypothetical protein